MTGSVTYARGADVASVARDRLDAAASALAAVEDAQRTALAALLELWPTSAWLAAGATSATRWLLAYTHCSEHEAHRLERVAGLCHRHPRLADAVLSGELALSRVEVLGRFVTDEREPWLADSLDTLLRLNATGASAEDWSTALHHWRDLVDQERTVRDEPRHSLTMTQRLFGGGEVHADLSPSAFLNVAAALDAWTDDPDPADGPYRRSLGERRADALDDLCRASLDPDDTRWGAVPDDTDGPEWEYVDWEGIEADDVVDGWTPTDTLDVAVEDDLDLTDPVERRAIAARDRHCVFPSCTRPPRMCDVHHLQHRAHGGPTKTANGAFLCRFHHRLLHEHGWTLSIVDGRWMATDRHGTTWTGRPRAPDRTPAKTAS